MQIGYKLSSEAFGPQELVRQALRAEEAGFDFVEISDHYHPWVEEQGHSPFTWVVLGAIAARTTTLGLATGVTCPTFRYHPAIIAQAAATLAVLSDGRFTLGVGAGERLNEHVIGAFPGVHERHDRLREAVEIISMLWHPGYHSYDGLYYTVDDARVFDLPETPPVIAVAASGSMSAALAGELGGGLFAVEPKSSIVEGFRSAGGTGPRFAEAPLAWAPTEQEAAEAAHETNRWALGGWKVMSELPNPVNFEAASRTVRVEDVREQFACGPDVERHLAVIRPFVDAGFDHVVLQNAGPDPDGFMDFFVAELEPRLRGGG
ncbi:LLM class F420-dependent oxidoreductase [Humibacter ginsengiterrae]